MELRGAGFRRFAVISAGFRNVWKCKSLGKTYYFRTWSRPKSDPTLQMQISMQTHLQIRMQTQFEVIFASVLPKYAPRSSGKHIFENQLWAIGLQKSTFWSIEGFKWGLIGPFFRYLWLSNFFFAAFPLQSPIQILKNRRQNVLLSHMEPSQIGSDLANANFNANASANSNANAIWSDFCLRLGPFEAIFASVWVRFRFVFRRLGLCKCTCNRKCNRKWKCNCYLIRATGGLSIRR